MRLQKNGDIDDSTALPVNILPQKRMKIACLGWGSLIWAPGSLPLRGGWRSDGPKIRVDYLRESGGTDKQPMRYLSLVLDEKGSDVRSYWSEMLAENIKEAVTNLRIRENIPLKYELEWIGIWRAGDPNPPLLGDLSVWAERRGVEVVIWTALPPKHNGKNGVAPNELQATCFLRALIADKSSDFAERYIRMTPRQIKTQLRKRFCEEFGWYPSDGSGWLKYLVIIGIFLWLNRMRMSKHY